MDCAFGAIFKNFLQVHNKLKDAYSLEEKL